MPALIALIAVTCMAFAIFQVVTSNETVPNKTVWTLLILCLPFLGFIVWVVSGPRGRSLLKK